MATVCHLNVEGMPMIAEGASAMLVVLAKSEGLQELQAENSVILEKQENSCLVEVGKG
jgi:hypothetical protein